MAAPNGAPLFAVSSPKYGVITPTAQDKTLGADCSFFF